MVDYLVAATLSNLLVSTILAVLAALVQRRIHSPGLTNLLWAVVLIKMVTPPIVAVSALTVPGVSGSGVAPRAVRSPQSFHQTDVGLSQQTSNVADSTVAALPMNQPTRRLPYGPQVVSIGIIVWMVVSGMLFAVSAARIFRFHCSLAGHARIHQELSLRLASGIARQFGLRKHPNIVETSANVAPFVWWMAGRGVIVVSSRAMQKLAPPDLRLIITHEMAHVKRRDHWFRWLEWIALITFWWNPIMWWARRQLRSSEEMACDQLVLQTSRSEVNQYANALLNMAELLTSPEIRPPVVASAVNSGGSLEKRLRVMMSKKLWTAPAALRTAVVVMAMCVFPLGFVYAQNFEAIERRLGGAVEAGELSLEQADLMMEALRRSSHGDRKVEAVKHRYMQFARGIEAAVESGKLSEEEAEKKLMHLRREMFEQKRHKGDEARELENRERRYEQAAQEIREAHEAGRLSEEEAEEKLIHLRREMFEQKRHKGDEARELEAIKQRYEHAERQIKEAHEAGRLSEEEAEKKLIHLRREMFEQERHKGDEAREQEARERRYEHVAREIKEAHEAGRLSEEQAEEKLIHLRREMFEQKRRKGDEARELENSERRYEQAAREIKEAHEAGRLTEEQAEEKLIHLRREVFGQVRERPEE